MKQVRDGDKIYIKLSHERCRQNGLSHNAVFSAKFASGDELQERLLKRKELVLIATHFMNQLYNFVKGTDFFSILTDEDGCILNVIGDDKILSEAFELRMIPGAFMDENNIGTNAMSVAISEGIPVQVSGKEHYIEGYHKWTCSAAPIRDTDGNIIGILDLTGYIENVNPHTLGMVTAAANAIEKMLQINHYNEELTSAKKNLEVVLDTITSGIIMSDLEGNISTFNSQAEVMFGDSNEELHNKKFYNIVDDWSRVVEKLLRDENFSDENVYVNVGRNKLQYSLTAYPVYNSEKKIIKIIHVLTETKKGRKLAGRILSGQAVYTFDKVIGRDKKFMEIIDYAKKIADSTSTVLIMGESGTGKEIFAQSIHNHSNRKDEPFVAVNCGAIPRTLIESELFGYEEGAFTGAKKGGVAGKFELADGGTIFLDEIGEMPLDMQIKLLRVIEEGVITRIGSGKPSIVNVRIIAATNKNLKEEVENRNFRKDLFYRLNVLPIILPPLRDRKEDIELLIHYYMSKTSKRLNKKMPHISDFQMKRLINYEWPGNIRELENFIERIINTDSMDFEVWEKGIGDEQKEISLQPSLTLEEMEKEYVARVLKECNGNVALAAQSLDIGRNTLYRKIKKYNIDCSILEQSSILEQV